MAYLNESAIGVGAMNARAAATAAGSAVPLSPVLRLQAAVEAAEKTASMVHTARVALAGDAPPEPTADAKMYYGEGLLGRIAEAASRIEGANQRILRDLEDLHRAYGDF